MTYFPRNQGGCSGGSQIPYLLPCRSGCEKYLESCAVECCDDSARCVFEFSLEAQKVSGYAAEEAPSAFCTGGRKGVALLRPLGGRSAGSRLGPSLSLLLALLTLQASRLGGRPRKGRGTAFRSGRWPLLVALVACSVGT